MAHARWPTIDGQSGMKNTMISLALVALLAACGGDADENNPVSGGPITDTDGAVGIPADGSGNDDIPQELAMNLEGVDFNPDSETLVISIGGLDAGSDTSTYIREATLDVPGFTAYTKQDDPLDRFFIALADRSPDETVQAFAISDGGQFNRYFGGTRFERLGTYTQPESGLVSYAGEYAGSTNIGDTNNPDDGDFSAPQLLPTPDGLSGSIVPRQPLRVRGDIFINVDFSEDKINGEIYNREVLRGDGVVVLTGQSQMPNMSLVVADINADGTFAGVVEEVDTQAEFGNYAGTFGGTNASSVGGAVKLERFSDDFENEEEFGAFALGRCGTAGDSDICDGLGN